MGRTMLNLKAMAERRMSLLICMIALSTCLLVPLRIVGHGYTPADDARRHAAKAVCGKTWSEILVSDHSSIVDACPGWHALLRAVHRAAGLEKDGLVAFSIVVPFTLLLAVGLLRRIPEAWFATLLLVSASETAVPTRFGQGRPFMVTALLLVLLLFIWEQRTPENRAARIRTCTLTALLAAAATWMHGAWYLLPLPAVALILARRFRDSGWYLAGTLVGIAFGAVLTEQPSAFLLAQWQHMLSAFLRGTPRHLLVSEFRGFRSPLPSLALVLGTLLWRAIRGRRRKELLQDPVFMLVCLCWLLGLSVARFWLDWGVPALLVWMSRELSMDLNAWRRRHPWRRLAAISLLCTGFVALVTNNRDGRWAPPAVPPPGPHESEQFADWLPGTGGTVYSASMQVFFDLFYWYPNGPWRYILGYEPGLMTDEHFRVYLNIQQHGYRTESVAEWLSAMKPEDRLVIISDVQPRFPALDWRRFVGQMWFGRLPTDPDQAGTSTCPATSP